MCLDCWPDRRTQWQWPRFCLVKVGCVRVCVLARKCVTPRSVQHFQSRRHEKVNERPRRTQLETYGLGGEWGNGEEEKEDSRKLVLGLNGQCCCCRYWSCSCYHHQTTMEYHWAMGDNPIVQSPVSNPACLSIELNEPPTPIYHHQHHLHPTVRVLRARCHSPLTLRQAKWTTNWIEVAHTHCVYLIEGERVGRGRERERGLNVQQNYSRHDSQLFYFPR